MRIDENTVLTIDPTYESPITRIAEESIKRVIESEEGYLIECVRNVGFNIDKEELQKALLYDRGQYEKGYSKGYSDGRMAREAEIVRCKDCKHSSPKVHICEITNYLYGANYFCAWGERREDVEETD